MARHIHPLDCVFAVGTAVVFIACILFTTGVFTGWDKPFSRREFDTAFIGTVTAGVLLIWLVTRRLWRKTEFPASATVPIMDAIYLIGAFPLFVASGLYVAGAFTGWERPFSTDGQGAIFMGVVNLSFIVVWQIGRNLSRIVGRQGAGRKAEK